jgi:hypothetical protein
VFRVVAGGGGVEVDLAHLVGGQGVPVGALTTGFPVRLEPGRASRVDRAVADHHATGVDAEVTGCVADLRGEREHVVGDGVLLARVSLGDRSSAVDLAGPCVLLTRGVAKGLGHVPDRGPRPVGDHVGDLGGVAVAVLGVDVLDGFLVAVGLDVDGW